LEGSSWIRREELDRTRMIELQMLDDDGGFNDGPPVVHQHRKALHRPQLLQRRCILVLAEIDHAKRERRAVLVERDEDLLAVGREGMSVESDHDRASFLMHPCFVTIFFEDVQGTQHPTRRSIFLALAQMRGTRARLVVAPSRSYIWRATPTGEAHAARPHQP